MSARTKAPETPTPVACSALAGGWLDLARRRGGTSGALLLGIFVALVIVDGLRQGHLDTGDTNNLVRGVREAMRCLDEGRFFRCGAMDDGRSAVQPFPLLQYILAAFSVSLGADDHLVLRTLAVASAMCMVGTLAWILGAFGRGSSPSRLALVAIIGSASLYHATSSFGEALTAFVVVGSVCAAIRRRPVEAFAMVLLASLGKETLAPFVVVLALVCARRPGDGWLPRRRFTIAVVAAGVLGIASNAAFNIFRYGTAFNTFYLDPGFRTPTVGRQLEFFVATFISPSGGLIWFWTGGAALAATGTALALRRVVSEPRNVRSFAPTAVIAGTGVLWLASLTAWYSPFGWISYGPRLQTPLLGGLVVAFVHAEGRAVIDVLRRSRAALLASLAVLAITCLQLAAPWRWRAAVDAVHRPPQGCPDFNQLDVRTDAAQYYRCVSGMLWRGSRTGVAALVGAALDVATFAWWIGTVGLVLVFVSLLRADHDGEAPVRRSADRLDAQPVAVPVGVDW